MSVAKNGDIPIVGLAAKLPLHVTDDEPRAVGRSVSHRRLGQCADKRKTCVQADLVAFIVAEASNQWAFQLAQRRDGKRRNQVTSK